MTDSVCSGREAESSALKAWPGELGCGEKAAELCRGEKAQLGTPANCLNFPSGFLADVLKAWFNNITTIAAICFFYLEALPEGMLCFGHASVHQKL